ncbi:MAG TPA: hypothetical protein VMB03_24935 [Bryobacteraceae bacterium]|nr:hypothetical protein [Bryobacteraceae bacterium]
MATPKQIAANRRNSQKSTGPRTEEGKARSAMNALKTGIDAKTQLIRGETQTALSELTAEYYGQYQPASPGQRALVDILIDCEWLLRRFRAIESQLYENAFDIFDITLGKVFTDNCDVFARLQRRIDSTQRHYHNALRALERLQAAEIAQPEAGPVPVTPIIQTLNPEIGFVPPILPAEPLDASPEAPALRL